MKSEETPKKLSIDGSSLKFGIVISEFHSEMSDELLKSAESALIKHGVKPENIYVKHVIGALEIPYACQKIIIDKKPDAIITLGVIIKGETSHYDLVSNETFRGIMQVQLANHVPISFGIIACDDVMQAKARLSKGYEAALAALMQTTL